MSRVPPPAAPGAVHPRSVLVVAATCFVALALAAAFVGALPADAVVRETLLGLGSDSVRAAMRVVNAAGDYRLLLPGTLALFVAFRRARERFVIWIGLMLVAAAGPDVLKVIVARTRPDDVSMGFPSGHATAAAAFFGAVMYLAASLPARVRVVVRIGAVAMILAVGAARVILRAHWPSDVLGGIAFGLALASAAALLASLHRAPADAARPRVDGRGRRPAG